MKNYNTIDLFKFICAILIVFMHTYCRDLGENGSMFVKTICAIGVPFFFITSGFFLGKGFERNNNDIDKKEYYKKYLSRLIKMYLGWSIITLPIAFIIVQEAYSEQSILFKIAGIFRLFFLVGSIGIYWYILSLIYCSVILFCYQRKGWRLLYLFIIATILWCCGTIYDSPFNNENILFKCIHVIFGSERNFLNVGLFYMIIGFYFQKYEHKLKMNSYILICLMCITIILRLIEVVYIGTNTLQALEATVLFILAINFNIKTNQAKIMRELSIAIYLLHFPFILLFDFYLVKGTLIDFSTTLLLCFIIFYFLKKYLPSKIRQTLFG